MKNLIEDTISKIKQQHIAPEPKWKYLTRKYALWALFCLVAVFGAMSLSAAFYLLSSLDWDLYRFMHQNIFSYSLSIFPYFWTAIIGAFIWIAFFDIRKTETGYRLSWLRIALIAIGSTILIGALMSYFGFGKSINDAMVRDMPYYAQHMMVTKESQWSQPEEGLLSGTIIAKTQNELTLTDLQGKKWIIQLNEKTLVRPRADVSVGQMIKIIGKVLGADNFAADEIRPWIGMGQGMMGSYGLSGAGNGRSGSMMNNSSGSGMMRRN